MQRLDPADLAAFAAVAEARGFRRAAARGPQSASALSEAVRRLESRLDLRLLNRTTRSVTPTAAGQRLLDRLAPALAGLDDAVAAALAGEGLGGTLKLNVPTAVIQHVLPPILARFMAAHPGIRVEVSGENRFLDVLAAGFDAGIRYGERLERDMIAVPIGPREQRFATAAAPAYLARAGRPEHPGDLLRHACLRFRFASGSMPNWEFARDGETIEIAPEGPLVADDARFLVEAAAAGLGVVQGFEEFLRPAIASGALEEILGPWSERFPGPLLYFPSRQHMPAPLRAFVDFVKSER